MQLRPALIPTALACLTIAAVSRRGIAQQERTPVVAGVAVHANQPRGIDTVVFQRSISRAGKDSATGTRTVVSRVVSGPDNMPLLEIEQRFPAGGGQIVDTAIAELSTLRAVAHRSHQPARTMRFDFTSGNADGTVASTAIDSAGKPSSVHQQLGGPIFDSNIIDVVIASLPLDTGFSTQLPFFIYERGGRVTMPVAVASRASIAFPNVGERDAWVVTIGVPGAPATVWVDARTKAVLRVRYDIAARGVSFIDDRSTPLRS